jgi:hypothetical protein
MLYMRSNPNVGQIRSNLGPFAIIGIGAIGIIGVRATNENSSAFNPTERKAIACAVEGVLGHSGITNQVDIEYAALEDCGSSQIDGLSEQDLDRLAKEVQIQVEVATNEPVDHGF